MSHKSRTLADLVHHQLKQLREAERHAGKLLARMAKAADEARLAAAFRAREAEVHAHAEPTDGLFGLIDRKPHDASCPLSDGLVAETRALIDDHPAGPVLDAALLAVAETLDHVLLARLGALRREAAVLGLAEARAPLEEMAIEARRALDGWARLAGGTGTAAPDATPFTLKQAALAGLR